MIFSVPSEINARGPRAKLAYENALKTGKVKVYRARIMLIGQDRAGKTSLKKSFLSLPFDPGEESTDGIEVEPSKFEVDIDRVKNWKRTDEKWGLSQFAADLAKMVAKKLQENTDDEEGGVEEINDADNEFEEEGDVNLVQVNKRGATSDFPATENAFEHKKKKPGLSANRPSNNWAVCLLPDFIQRGLSSGPHIRDYQQPKRAHPT